MPKHRTGAVAASDPEQELTAKRARERVWDALSTLDQAHREVIVMCLLEERTNAEAASLLGIPVGTVKSRLRVARSTFKRALEDEDGELAPHAHPLVGT